MNIIGVNTIPWREIPKLPDLISFLVPKIFGFRMPNFEIVGLYKVSDFLLKYVKLNYKNMNEKSLSFLRSYSTEL